MKKFNPYSILVLTIIGVLVLYEFKWSSLYPSLSPSVIVFFVITILALLVMNYFIKKMVGNSNNDIKPSYKYNKLYGVIVMVVVIGTLLDGIYSKGFPLLGNLKYGDEFGVPFLHVLTSILDSFITYMLAMVLTFEKKFHFKPLLLFLVTLICLLLPFSRLLIILTFSNYLWSLLFYKVKKRKITLKKIVLSIFVACGCLYLFGIFGNYRMNIQTGTVNSDLTDSSLIYQIGMPSDQFKNSKIPSPYFWDYIYLTSSIGNLQNIINYCQPADNKIGKFVITQFVPDTISKKIYTNYNDEVKVNTFQYQISPSLNVGTIFYEPYYLFGWLGVYSMMIYLLFFPIVYLILIRGTSDKYYVYGFAVLDTIYLLALFDNMLILSVLSLQLFIPIIYKLIKGSKVR